MLAKHHLFIVAVIFFSGCSSSDDDVVGEEQLQPVTEGAYTDECRWIYRQMNHYYLWREDMPDSATCDYSTDPVTFFKSLLSPKDRFSYCERNTGYTGPASVFKDDGDYADEGLTRSASGTVFLDSVYLIGNKIIGYLCYTRFEDIAELAPVIRKFKEAQVDELIVDLRYNPGGYVSVCKYLCNSIVGESGYGNTFQYQGFNNIIADELYRETGTYVEADLFEHPTREDEHILGTPLYGLNMSSAYVLTSSRTASASEALIVCLRPYMNITVIGEQTVGKGVGSSTIRNSRYKYELHPITLRYYNAKGESTPDDGIVPDYTVSGGNNTYKKDIGNTEEPLLNLALKLIAQQGKQSFNTNRR